jgi:hypothetical protein
MLLEQAYQEVARLLQDDKAKSQYQHVDAMPALPADVGD